MKFIRKFLNNKIINIIFGILGIIIIMFLIYRLKTYFNQIEFHSIQINLKYLILSFAVAPIWFSIRCFVWKHILKQMGEEISLIDSMRLIGLSNFGKYIPGKVWFTVGRTVLAERLGIPKRKSFTSIIIDTYFLVLISLVFLLVLITKISFTGTNYIPWAIGMMVVMIPFIIPKFTKRIMNRIFHLLGKEGIEYNMNFRSVITILAMDFIMWSLQGVQFYFLVRSIAEFSFSPFIVLLVYPAAWSMGFLILLMPAGLGIREGLITFSLTQIFPQESSGIAIIAALISRIQFTIIELSYLFTLIGSKNIWRSNGEKRKDN